MSLAKRIEAKHLHPASLPREMRWRDIAYASFLACGLLMAGASLLNWIPSDTWLYLGLSWLYRFPLLFLFTTAAVLGTAFSLVAWRESRLHVLSSSTLLLGLLPWLVMRWPAIPDLVAGGFFFTYILLAIGLPLWWFLVDRRGLLRRYPPQRESRWLEAG